MKFSQILTSGLLLAFSPANCLPTSDTLNHDRHQNSFAGVNSYFLHAFKKPDRIAVLDAAHQANLKLLRIFISYTPADNKNTGSVEMPDIEPKHVGTYDDTQLHAIDDLMVEAHARDIKLVIAMHDRYQLGCWGNDTYAVKYNLPQIDCTYQKASLNDAGVFYSNPKAIKDFDHRIEHILEHRNHKIAGSPKWKDLSEHIFSLEIQNEGQGHNGDIPPYPHWWCDRSKFMRKLMDCSKVKISTGGGNAFSNSDIPENWACPTLDVVDVHSYDNAASYNTTIPGILKHALDAKKLMILEEFGATGANKAADVKQHIDVINSYGIPWMIWEMSKPGKGTGDFEFWTDEDTYGVVAQGAKEALKKQAAQNFRQ